MHSFDSELYYYCCILSCHPILRLSLMHSFLEKKCLTPLFSMLPFISILSELRRLIEAVEKMCICWCWGNYIIETLIFCKFLHETLLLINIFKQYIGKTFVYFMHFVALFLLGKTANNVLCVWKNVFFWIFQF